MRKVELEGCVEGGNTLGWVEREYGPGGSIKMTLVPISFPDLLLFFFLPSLLPHAPHSITLPLVSHCIFLKFGGWGFGYGMKGPG